MKNDQNCLVVQFIFRSGEDKEDRDELVGGWAVIRLKPWTEDDDMTKAISNRYYYHQTLFDLIQISLFLVNHFIKVHHVLSCFLTNHWKVRLINQKF
jgi:hypothetical protein